MPPSFSRMRSCSRLSGWNARNPLGPNRLAPGLSFTPDSTKTNQWQVFDDNLCHLSKYNLTGLFFDCPSAEDITIGPLYLGNTSYTVAITNQAVYDAPEQPPIISSLTLYSTSCGSVSPSNSTYPYCSNVIITASPLVNYTFAYWTGYGTSTDTGPDNQTQIIINDNITDIAVFRSLPIYINRTVYVSVNQTVYVPVDRNRPYLYIPWWIWLIMPSS